VIAMPRISQLLATAPRRLQDTFDKAVLQEGQFLRTKIVEGIREQAPGGRAFAPLAPTTLAIRKFRGFGATKALLVHGDLRNSITVTKVGDQVFVGILRTARTRTGQPLVDVAALHELGSRPIVTRLTPKARAFLHAAFRRAGLDTHGAGGPTTGIAVLRVPARPFFAPVFEKHAQPDAVAKRLVERAAKALGGDFGNT
jgi:phage gpG-like protein